MKIFKMTTHGSRRVFVAGLLSMPLIMAACDPGVTIRQADSPKDVGKPSSVTFRVKSVRQLIGTTHYAPQVTATNNSEATVVVTGIELATRQKIDTESSSRPQDFPAEVLAKQARDFTVLFRLDEAVYKAFKEPAELRIHHRSGTREDTARLAIVLGALDDSR
jgi:hypothetical protein